MTTETRETVLFLTTDTKAFDDYLRLTLAAAYLTDAGELRFFVDSWGDEPLANLQISAQLDSAAETPYGWRVEYRDVYAVDLARAETMTKLLRKVTRALEKLENELGYAESFSAYVARVAKVLGVKRYVWRVGDARGEYGFGDARQLGYRIDRAVSEFRQPAGAR